MVFEIVSTEIASSDIYYSGNTTNPWVFDKNIDVSDVTAELINLAEKHTGLKVGYKDMPVGTTGSCVGMGSIWKRPDQDITPFWIEYERLRSIIRKPLNEPILPDEYPVYQGYLYVVDGKVREFIDGERMTIGRWKSLRIPGVVPVTEVRRCDVVGRRLRLPPPEEERVKQSVSALTTHRRRKPRCSNKIKKVK